MEWERLLNELENVIMDAPRIPLSNKCVIDTERLCQIMDGIRGAVPVEIKRAQELIRNQERRINEANEEKKRIIEQAQAIADKMVSEQEIYREAQERAETAIKNAGDESSEIKSSAEQYSQTTREEAVDFANQVHDETEKYVKEVFEYMEGTFDKITDALQQSKTALGKKMRGED